MGKARYHFLKTDPERALFEGKVQALAATLYQNELPPRGLCGVLDWYFQGAISRSIRSGAISGAQGELIYFPFHRNGSTFHIFLAGAGIAAQPGQRERLSTRILSQLKKNLSSLHLSSLGISISDFGNESMEVLAQNFEEVPLWITP